MPKITPTRLAIIQVISYYPPHLGGMENCAAQIVVASDAPEIRQILSECGVLIQDPTAINYAKTLDALLLKRDALRHMSDLSIQKARSYSWERVLESIEKIYKEVYKEVKS